MAQDVETLSYNDLVWIRDALERIEGRLEREGNQRDTRCNTESIRLAALERWRSMLVGAWVVVTTEATVGLTILGIVVGKG